MSKYKIIDVWNRVFGAKQEAYDYTGRLMKKSACGNPNSAYHPTLDHIRPLSAGGCSPKRSNGEARSCWLPGTCCGDRRSKDAT